MKFYKSIASYYDYIFPLKQPQLNFVLENTKEYENCKILDIGCATGDLAWELGKNNISVVGIDLDEEMVNIARTKYTKDNISFNVMDMKNIYTEYGKDSFHVVTCFGNTLVHLNDEKEIYETIKAMRDVLKQNGKILIQILNYQYINDQCIRELPLIENDYIKFQRFYSDQARDVRLIFETTLTVKKTNEIISNDIYLYPITKDRLEDILNDLGFSNIKFYANFNKEAYSYSHIPLVLEAQKL